MSAPKFNEGRLAQVLVAPIVSEKATMIAEKQNQVLFKVLRDATKPEIKALLTRRDMIVKYFDEQIAAKGEAAVLYDLPPR